MRARTLVADTAKFRDLCVHLLETGYAVRFEATGASMAPAIRDGDIVTVAPVAEAEIRRGDVLFYSSGRRTIVHRVVDIRVADDAPPTFILRGDAKQECDPPVTAGQVLGRVVAIERSKAARLQRTLRRVGRTLFFFLLRRRSAAHPTDAAVEDPPGI